MCPLSPPQPTLFSKTFLSRERLHFSIFPIGQTCYLLLPHKSVAKDPHQSSTLALVNAEI